MMKAINTMWKAHLFQVRISTLQDNWFSVQTELWHTSYKVKEQIVRKLLNTVQNMTPLIKNLFLHQLASNVRVLTRNLVSKDLAVRKKFTMMAGLFSKWLVAI